MMSAVILPEEVHVVHESVVPKTLVNTSMCLGRCLPVEPEVKNDPIQAYLKWQPVPVEGCWSLIPVVADYDSDEGPKAGCGNERAENFANRPVRYFVPSVLVAVEEAMNVTKMSHDYDLVDSYGLEPDAII